MSVQFRRIVNAIPRAGTDLGGDRLAFFALTSKPELLIRDAIAWQLHSAFGESCLIAREWLRTDLAVMSEDGSPMMLLEAKAMYSFDAISSKSLNDYMLALEADRGKAERLANDDTEIVLLVLLTHVSDAIPYDLKPVVKYRNEINSALATHPTDDLRETAVVLLSRELSEIGQEVRHVPTASGEAFGIQVDISAFVVGIYRG